MIHLVGFPTRQHDLDNLLKLLADLLVLQGELDQRSIHFCISCDSFCQTCQHRQISDLVHNPNFGVAHLGNEIEVDIDTDNLL